MFEVSKFGGDMPLYCRDVHDLSVKQVVANENDFKCANVAFTPNQFYFVVKFNEINCRRNKLQTMKAMEKRVAKQE